MIRRRGFVLLTVFVLVAVLIVGSGFAYFFFGSGQVEVVHPGVSVRVDNMQVGKVSFDGSKTYRLFLDTDGLYLIDESNPTKEAEIDLVLSEFSDYKVSLVCDVVISDQDARGISALNYNVTEKGVEKTEHHDVSESILDYFEPDTVDGRKFEVMEQTDKAISYRCVIIDDVKDTDTSPKLKVSFRYKTVNGADMTPGTQYATKQGFATVMHYLNEAMTNGSISITFRMITTENGGTT